MIRYKMFMHNTFTLIIFVLVSHPTAFLQNGSGNAGQAGNNPPPPPEPDMTQVL
jgi:hypothetical protein